MIRRSTAIAFVALLLVACGGTKTNDDAGADVVAPFSCPATASDGSSCTGQGECEYAGPAAYCGDVLACINGTFMDSTTTCSLPVAPCPSTSADVQIGQACTTKITCEYPDARCGCVTPSGPAQLDGSAMTWECTTAPAGCPAQHPALGTTCATEGQLCDYGACVFIENPYSSALAEKCSGGIWVRASVPCPA